MNMPAKIHENCPSCKPKDYNQTKARFMGQEKSGEYLYQCVECAAELWVTEAWAKKHAAAEDKEQTSVKNLVFELQHEVGAMGLQISNFEDIEVLLGHLLEDMENSNHQGNEKLYFENHQRMVRVIWNLTRSSLGDLKLQKKELDSISEAISYQVRNQEEKENSNNVLSLF